MNKLNNLHKIYIAEIRQAIVVIRAEIKLIGRGKHSESQALIIIAEKAKYAEKILKELERNGF